MVGQDDKLRVLADIAHVLNAHHVVWAVGGSLLLYFREKADSFHDIDLMVCEEDAEKVRSLLCAMGGLAPAHPNAQYKTRHFLEYTIRGVDVDVLAGFVIVKDGTAYDCSLRPEQIAGCIELHGERIPLQALQDWRRYYELMGRTQKVKMIDR